MDVSHYLILRYLIQNPNGVSVENFPNEIKSLFVQRTLAAGSLNHEMQIVLKGQKQWVCNKPRQKGYFITDEGKQAFDREQELRQKEENKESLNYEKLKLEVDALRNQFFDYPATKSRAKWAVIWAAIAALIAAISWIWPRR